VRQAFRVPTSAQCAIPDTGRPYHLNRDDACCGLEDLQPEDNQQASERCGQSACRFEAGTCPDLKVSASCWRGLENLAPDVVNGAVALVDEDDVERLDGEARVIRDFYGPPLRSAAIGESKSEPSSASAGQRPVSSRGGRCCRRARSTLQCGLGVSCSPAIACRISRFFSHRGLRGRGRPSRARRSGSTDRRVDRRQLKIS
jgi:hypothetical protein